MRLWRSVRFMIAVLAPVCILAGAMEAWARYMPAGEPTGSRIPSEPPKLEPRTVTGASATLQRLRELTKPGEVNGVVDLAASGRWLFALAPEAKKLLIAVDTKTG